MKKPRITVQREQFDDGSSVVLYRVRFPAQGWKNRLCMSWEEALFAAGVLTPKPL